MVSWVRILTVPANPGIDMKVACRPQFSNHFVFLLPAAVILTVSGRCFDVSFLTLACPLFAPSALAVRSLLSSSNSPVAVRIS